ncbi:hypothetical protein HII31_10111 [Pseudocercospora fuligena]|uniref:UBC core domain-containing protein n=1 Tax=Pseudocercospora fuligena TaxID=685502 RepID=A0A8H6RCJ2_9PEZI|nr:hypothetical protein HII31_10111 [Pseudocercospora fuligena]
MSLPSGQASSSFAKRTGPYASAILRFQIDFPDDYPHKPPVVAFQSDVFHPLVTPLTTYTYSTRDFGTDTQSAADEQRLPPGGLSLRHGFPEWFDDMAKDVAVSKERGADVPQEGGHQGVSQKVTEPDSTGHQRAPHVIEVLQYMRIVFDTEEVLDTIPLDAAANAGAWHAWQSYRSKSSSRAASVARQADGERVTNTERSVSPRQQPGGARRPGEWNWQGVWEDRVRRSIQNSLSEPVLFGGDNNDVISFLKMDADAISQISPAARQAQDITA